MDLRSDLDCAKLRLEQLPDSEDPEQMEREIWYRPNRDAPQTAISKLFTAIRELHQRNNCVWASSAVVANLTADEWSEMKLNCTSIEMYNIVLNSYFDTLNKSESDNEPPIVG